jgi:hypothetical protein
VHFRRNKIGVLSDVSSSVRMKSHMIKFVRKSSVILAIAHVWVACLIHIAESWRATGRPSRLRSMAACYRQCIANLAYLGISYLDNGMLLCKVLQH